MPLTADVEHQLGKQGLLAWRDALPGLIADERDLVREYAYGQLGLMVGG